MLYVQTAVSQTKLAKSVFADSYWMWHNMWFMPADVCVNVCVCLFLRVLLCVVSVCLCVHETIHKSFKLFLTFLSIKHNKNIWQSKLQIHIETIVNRIDCFIARLNWSENHSQDRILVGIVKQSVFVLTIFKTTPDFTGAVVVHEVMRQSIFYCILGLEKFRMSAARHKF